MADADIDDDLQKALALSMQVRHAMMGGQAACSEGWQVRHSFASPHTVLICSCALP